ncbi:MAG: hypothetical protein ACREIV_01325, partial [Planctomycetaceae bacterium]
MRGRIERGKAGGAAEAGLSTGRRAGRDRPVASRFFSVSETGGLSINEIRTEPGRVGPVRCDTPRLCSDKMINDPIMH